MVEFLWMADESEARLVGDGRLRLFDRWRLRDWQASPFGICLRPGNGARQADPPFAGWAYRPSCLPGPLFIHMDDQSEEIRSPLIFYLLLASLSAPRRGHTARLPHRPPSIPFSQWSPVPDIECAGASSDRRRD